MTQPTLTLYHFPGACSQVALCALEEAGLDYRLELVDLQVGAQNAPDYLAVNPLGKVPYLLIDGEGLAENAAILTYIAQLRPEAHLLPSPTDARAFAQAVGGMSFCGGTLHPAVRGIANPVRLTTGDIAGVRERATELATKNFKQADRRIADKSWWLGDWSIVDVYLHWAFEVACNKGFDPAPFPHLAALTGRLLERPSFATMMAMKKQPA